MTDDITQGKGSGRPPGCSCHPDDRPPVCQKEHATTHCKLAYAEAELTEAREIIAGLIDGHDETDREYQEALGELLEVDPNVINVIHPIVARARAFLKGEKNDG